MFPKFLSRIQTQSFIFAQQTAGNVNEIDDGATTEGSLPTVLYIGIFYIACQHYCEYFRGQT